jgi:hypothetical protein
MHLRRQQHLEIPAERVDAANQGLSGQGCDTLKTAATMTTRRCWHACSINVTNASICVARNKILNPARGSGLHPLPGMVLCYPACQHSGSLPEYRRKQCQVQDAKGEPLALDAPAG